MNVPGVQSILSELRTSSAPDSMLGAFPVFPPAPPGSQQPKLYPYLARKQFQAQRGKGQAKQTELGFKPMPTFLLTFVPDQQGQGWD